jgi:hypothetical protein
VTASLAVLVTRAGGHTHARVFMGRDREHRALLGTLVGDAEQIAILVDMLALGALEVPYDVEIEAPTPLAIQDGEVPRE